MKKFPYFILKQEIVSEIHLVTEFFIFDPEPHLRKKFQNFGLFEKKN